MVVFVVVVVLLLLLMLLLLLLVSSLFIRGFSAVVRLKLGAKATSGTLNFSHARAMFAVPGGP